MEKFRIAQYGFIQMVALSYGILGAGTMVKISKQTWTMFPPPAIFKTLAFYRDYGLLLAFIIIAWASFCAFHSSIFSKRNFDEDKIVGSGLLLSGIFFALGSYMLIGGIVNIFPPASLYK